VVSLGCRLNLAEGEAIRRLAGDAGLGEAIVVNSCAVTNEAVRQTRQEIRRARRRNPSARIIVTGCAAQIDAAAFAALSEVDAVLGNSEKLAPEAWRRIAAAPDRVIAVDDIMAVRETAPHLVDGYGDRARAFLQVQNGCNHRCTFCIIPFGRGPARSIKVADAVAAVRRLVAAGHPEIVLTGVDLTSWGQDLSGAPRLGRLVSAILDQAPELFRLRLSSLDCGEIDEELFARATEDRRVAPHFHLSLQSGSNLILKRMKRRHRREQAIALAEALRARRPEIALGADFIAGFPTETEEMFAETLSLISEAGINYGHIFPYSIREGAPASRMPQCDGRIIAARARRLRQASQAATRTFLDGCVGSVEDAVVESGGRARLGNFAAVRAPAGARAGDVMRIRIVGRDGDVLIADPCPGDNKTAPSLP
jgi:threonylcarbamoyladenosine tRNA methylthiotransferase MtaB